jgi:hypothetical protein
MQEKEQRWQNEIDAITQEFSDHQASARQKDEDTTKLRENLHSLKEHQNDALTNKLDHLHKAGELANADSQKGDRVGGSWSGLPNLSFSEYRKASMNFVPVNDWLCFIQIPFTSWLLLIPKFNKCRQQQGQDIPFQFMYCIYTWFVVLRGCGCT